MNEILILVCLGKDMLSIENFCRPFKNNNDMTRFNGMFTIFTFIR